MPRRKFTVMLDDRLYDRARAELPPEVTMSSMLAEAVRVRLEGQEACRHPTLRCASCGVEVPTAEPAEPQG